MAYLHTETITRACAELNPGESYVLQFPTSKDAHNEYCYFRTALRSAVQKIPAAKTLSISRNSNSVIISMGFPAVLYPTPVRVKTSTLSLAPEESQIDLSYEPAQRTSPLEHPMLARIKADLAEGLISPEDAEEAIAALSTCNPSQEL
jgi:hypothetical protein